jgi:hypothetical protein
MKCSFEKTWKNWAAAGFLLAGGAYTGVMTTVGIKPFDDALNSLGLTEIEKDSIKAGVGLLGSLLVAGLSVGLFKAQQKVRSCFFVKREPTENDTLKKQMGANVAYNSLDVTVVIDNPAQNKARDDKAHAAKCNALVEIFQEKLSSGRKSRAECIREAENLRNEYAHLTDFHYFLHIKSNGYVYKDIPIAVIQPLSHSPNAHLTFAKFSDRRITPDSQNSAASAYGTPDSPPPPHEERSALIKEFAFN